MRQVEIAVGLTDYTWITLTISVPEDPAFFQTEDEIGEEALETAKGLGEIRPGSTVKFYAVLEVSPYEDPLEGIV